MSNVKICFTATLVVYSREDDAERKSRNHDMSGAGLAPDIERPAHACSSLTRRSSAYCDLPVSRHSSYRAYSPSRSHLSHSHPKSKPLSHVRASRLPRSTRSSFLRSSSPGRPSSWSLGIMGKFLGGYLVILIDSRVEDFRIDVLLDPMYFVNTM